MIFKKKLKKTVRDDSILVDFRPLTHIEIEQNKKLRVALSDDLMYETSLQRVDNLILWFGNKDMIFSGINGIYKSKTLAKASAYRLFIDLAIKLVWQISDKPNGFFERLKLKKKIFKFFKDDVMALFNLTDKILDYESRLFF